MGIAQDIRDAEVDGLIADVEQAMRETEARPTPGNRGVLRVRVQRLIDQGLKNYIPTGAAALMWAPQENADAAA